MKIAIVGTRGIPNNYGGFEQFAQYLSLELIRFGNDVTVYNPSYRKELDNNWNGVYLKKIFCLRFFNSFSQVVYDYLSIKDAIKEKFDIIFVCGYVSSYFAFVRFSKYKTKMVVHMDGWEWKRKKWNFLTRRLILFIEKQVVRKMPYLVADHQLLENYYLNKYNKSVYKIDYGCNIKDIVPIKTQIDKPFFLLIARNEKENNVDFVCKSFLDSGVDANLYVFTNKKAKIKSEKIKWFLNEYHEDVLNFYRNQALAYVHAYTVGGTNPSLLESMAYCKTIIALDNDFHRLILEENALYFKTKHDLVEIFKIIVNGNKLYLHLEFNRLKILKNYQWTSVAHKYMALFKTMMNE